MSVRTHRVKTTRTETLQLILTETELMSALKEHFGFPEDADVRFDIGGGGWFREHAATIVHTRTLTLEQPANGSMQELPVPLDLLRDALNPDAGEVVSANNGPRGGESTDCTGCGARNATGWHAPVMHRTDCPYVRREQALQTLRALLAQAVPATPPQEG